jgi:hypothetical protein
MVWRPEYEYEYEYGAPGQAWVRRMFGY